jgi:hypothetical protein
MREEDIVDPRVVPRWVPVGVSGVPRGREWDAVAVVEVPELEGEPLEEIVFVKLPDGSLGGYGPDVPTGAVERLAARLDGLLDSPYEARAARRGTREWSVAARTMNIDLALLPPELEAEEITLAVSPDGTSMLLVDGQEPEVLTPELAQAAAELRRCGSLRFAAFAVRAERIGPARWSLTIDPL